MSRRDDLIELGRAVVGDGRLADLRAHLGFSTTYMAEVLMTNVATYRNWERRPTTKLWDITALRVGRFFTSAHEAVVQLEEDGTDLSNLTPLHAIAPKLGITHEVLLQRYRRGGFEAVDLGILGLWVEKSQLAKIKVRA